MIKRLRRKFIFINMLLVTFVLTAVLSALCVSTAMQQREACHQALERALFMEKGFRPQLNFGRMDKPDAQPGNDAFLSSFCVLLDESGRLLSLQSATVDIDEEDIQSAVSAALDSGKSEGVLAAMNLSFLIFRDKGETRVAFVDTSSLKDALVRLIVSCSLIGLGSLAAFFFISLFLAHWALRPVERAWQQQRQFIADASHELKTPLTVILANTGILLSHPDDVISTQLKWLEYTQAEGEHMKKLISDMLFLAKSDTQDGGITRLPLSLSDAVLSAFLPFESVAFERGLALEGDVMPNIMLSGDEGQLRQLVMILLDNACKYTPRGGSIRLSLEKNRDRIILRVVNTGETIPAECLGALFDRFYRVDKARSREMGGYGLGLSIAKRICENHGGRISVESSAEKGTAFTVTLPVR